MAQMGKSSQNFGFGVQLPDSEVPKNTVPGNAPSNLFDQQMNNFDNNSQFMNTKKDADNMGQQQIL